MRELVTKLLETLSKIKGKFLLSSYRSDILKQFTISNNWQTLEIKGVIQTRAEKPKRKVEVLTANYELKMPKKQTKKCLFN
jgi:DNA adenine methylase